MDEHKPHQGQADLLRSIFCQPANFTQRNVQQFSNLFQGLALGYPF